MRGEARVVRDADQKLSFVQGIGYDITELNDAEEILRRSREELEELKRILGRRAKINFLTAMTGEEGLETKFSANCGRTQRPPEFRSF